LFEKASQIALCVALFRVSSPDKPIKVWGLLFNSAGTSKRSDAWVMFTISLFPERGVKISDEQNIAREIMKLGWNWVKHEFFS
jgi:hypothetical protein